MFQDRKQVGELLFQKLKNYRNQKNTLILAIPRGGVEVGKALAKKLKLPLDVILTKKIGLPGNEEYAIGAVTMDNYFIDENFRGKVSEKYVQDEVERLRVMLKERFEKYHQHVTSFSVRNKTVIIIDDGIATGQTMEAAIAIARNEGAKKIIAAVPVAAPDTVQLLQGKADEFICLHTPETFFAISPFYDDFSPVSDERAIQLLKEANQKK